MVQTPFGFLFTGNRGMVEGRFEPTETRFVTDMLTHVDWLVNIGANIGYYCCHALAAGRSVVAFEPVNHNLLALFRNLQANHWESRAEVFPIALGAEVGIAEIYGGGTSASLLKGWAKADTVGETTSCNTLDNCLAARMGERPALVVIDTEGFEFEVLRGAGEILRQTQKHVWMIEISVFGHRQEINPHYVDTFRMFEESGYACWCLGDTLQPVTIGDVQAAVAERKERFGNHNYVFADAGRFAVSADGLRLEPLA